MKKDEWRRLITRQTKKAGTYKPYFKEVIDTLAGIMEMRDSAMEKYIAAGAAAVVKYTNKGGSTNIVKNPAMVAVLDCNAQALAYWRDLGLTPAGLKKLSSSAVDPGEKKSASLEDLLSQLQ